ncbi:MAG: glycosyltransferase family 2 protein [Bacilli bacterium]|nr:glycosyltransferase family 2 protein [Bacilli bacterium]
MYSFIILHYKNIDDTINCLSNLKNLANKDTNFIVVDNNTLSDSEIKLIKKFTNDIVKLDSNYGFAKANNKGLAYAKKKYNSKFYIVINNDVFISQNNFLDIINKDYQSYSFDMLGPSISSPSGESINPFPVIKEKKDVENEIKKCNKLIKIYSNSLLYILLNCYLKIKHMFIKNNKPINGKTIEKGVALHGCAIIFSDKYIRKYKYPFYNDTFLFHEEEFLYVRIVKDDLTSIYDPNLKVFHKEGSSIKKSNNGIRKSKLFREKERLKSLYLLLKEM